ncbi:hypothetical protein GNF76_16010 [Pseudomonas sp. CCM 7893]|uniref:Protein activator of alkane oxidation PraB n=1 Tax=Pseudomonas spelaei TaxID=1055469 RepID=A0A6I3W5E9_9PSED|nr:alkane oxidation protein activator PraB [Pseudomonas spelaei]MUF05860.1 hypothetical protein [Pseudomonas spelaei]
MNGLSKIIINGALLVGFSSATYMASAASFVPPGMFSGAGGTITIKTPTTFGSPVTCGISVNGSIGEFTEPRITGVSITGAGVCGLLKANYLSWPLRADSLTSGYLSEVGFTIKGILPATNCGFGTMNINWNNVSKRLTVSNQALSGNCTVVSLEIVLPSLSIAN